MKRAFIGLPVELRKTLYFLGIALILQGYYRHFARILSGYYQAITWQLSGYHLAIILQKIHAPANNPMLKSS